MMPGNGQYEIKESFYHLDISCRSIAEKFGKPLINEWTNGDYIRLSSKLSRTTSVQISPNTLKRIFGKLKTPERYYPQRATRDALVQFLGYKDWDLFVASHPRPAKHIDDLVIEEKIKVSAEPQLSQVEPGPRLHKRSVTLRYLWLGVAVLAVLTTAIWLSKKDKPLPLLAKAGFTCKNPEGKNPHSAVFTVGIPKDFEGDINKFTVNFGDGRPEHVVSSGIVFTHYYEIPGRYYAVLKYDGVATDTIPVYLKTNGWTATATVERDSIRVYPVSDDSLFRNKYLTASAFALKHAGVDTTRTFFVEFVNSQPTTISGDNFELVLTAKSSEDRAGVRCSQISTVIYGEKSFHKLLVMKPGCEAWTSLTFSDYHRDGRADDLNFLAADFSKGGTLLLRVKNKNVSLLLNGAEICTAHYNLSMGPIYGIKVAFAGVGEIHNVNITDLGTGDVFKNTLTQ